MTLSDERLLDIERSGRQLDATETVPMARELRELRAEVERLREERTELRGVLRDERIIRDEQAAGYLKLIGEVETENRRLRERLEDAVRAIDSLPEDALGRHPQTGHPYRDELLHNLRAALAHSGDSGEEVVGAFEVKGGRVTFHARDSERIEAQGGRRYTRPPFSIEDSGEGRDDE